MSKKPYESDDKYYCSEEYIDFKKAADDWDYTKLKELLSLRKVDVNKHATETIVNAIKTLVRLNDSKLLSELLLSTNIQEKNIDINNIMINDYDLLWMADISSQNIDLIYVLLKAGYNTLYRPNDHFSLLHIVSKYDSVDAVKHVLNLRYNSHKFNPNTSDLFNGQTPLHYAIYGKNCPNVIKALLEAGTDPTIRHEAFSRAKGSGVLADNAFELALESCQEYKPYEKTMKIILDHIITATLTGKEFKGQISLPPQYKAYFMESLKKQTSYNYINEEIIPLFSKVLKVTDDQFYEDCATIIKIANKSLEGFSLNENALIGALNKANYAPAGHRQVNEVW